ncbi:hypothetical protein BaRGS_00028442 [Batillaria attramentaria]|uniref:Uncharacterized protein n=1 Tax=Batillaria attramentaria TaxID=370345 RepID=A0ABD0JZ44_9CAEN
MKWYDTGRKVCAGGCGTQQSIMSSSDMPDASTVSARPKRDPLGRGRGLMSLQTTTGTIASRLPDAAVWFVCRWQQYTEGNVQNA